MKRFALLFAFAGCAFDAGAPDPIPTPALGVEAEPQPSPSPEPEPSATPVPPPPSGGRWRPVAPTAAAFEWQGLQTRLAAVPPYTGTCGDARIAISMQAESLCFADHAGVLRCAGTLRGGIDFGTTFSDAGISKVEQILGSPTIGGTGACATEGCAALCVRKSDGKAWCIGAATTQGQFNLGSLEAPGTKWARWGHRADIDALATGTWDQICARYRDGTAECVGAGFGTEPVAVGAPPVERLWIDTFGQVHANDMNVHRASANRSQCTVRSSGLSCFGGTFGVAGRVVDGGDAGRFAAGTHAAHCWLDDDGAVWCADYAGMADGAYVTHREFANVPGRAVAVVVNPYSLSYDESQPTARCAVFDDGSLWCIGTNEGGKLGTGSTAPLVVETEVAPAGSVRITCEQ